MNNNISTLRRRAGLSQSQLADKLGTTLSMMGKIERGDRELSMKWIERISAVLGCQPTELLAPSQVPVVGYVGAGARVFAFSDTENGAHREEVERPTIVTGNVVAAEVRGESMLPLAEEGWHILYSRERDFDEAAVLNKVCVVELEDSTVLVKRVVQGSRPKQYHLLSMNAPMIPDVRIVWAAPVKAIIPS